mmetsp:Transcript_91928/g.265170  ORF Transcript_91928/g.265170 Transcript_91928/m.265170 type:complete len:299 (+) Transcript_91928:678-1574(+)
MMASTRFVKPNCTDTNAPAKMKNADISRSMTGIAHAPQESPATNVWKKRIVEFTTELNATAHRGSRSSIPLLIGLMNSTASKDHPTSMNKIMTMPQIIACIAPMKPPIILKSVGNRFRTRITRMIRARRKIRRMLIRFSSGTPASAMPAKPTPTMTASRRIHRERKLCILPTKRRMANSTVYKPSNTRSTTFAHIGMQTMGSSSSQAAARSVSGMMRAMLTKMMTPITESKALISLPGMFQTNICRTNLRGQLHPSIAMSSSTLRRAMSSISDMIDVTFAPSETVLEGRPLVVTLAFL